jgi:hypothetical protein
MAMAKAPVDKNDFYYKMNHPKRGLAIIFNHEHFSQPNLSVRNGTNVDAENLRETFELLGFDVTIHKDLIFSDLEYVVEKSEIIHESGMKQIANLHSLFTAAKLNHEDNDCIIIIVLSHGEDKILYAKDTSYKPEILWSAFTADKCPTLAGKPKLFFIQARKHKLISKT